MQSVSVLLQPFSLTKHLSAKSKFTSTNKNISTIAKYTYIVLSNNSSSQLIYRNDFNQHVHTKHPNQFIYIFSNYNIYKNDVYGLLTTENKKRLKPEKTTS